MAKDKKEVRRGGLGRGLAALIPTAPEQQPRVGDSAADIIFGKSTSANGTNETKQSGRPNLGGLGVAADVGQQRREAKNSGIRAGGSNTEPGLNPGTKRHSDDNDEITRNNRSEVNQNAGPNQAAANGSRRDKRDSDNSNVTSSRTKDTGRVEHESTTVAPTANEFGATYQEIALEHIAPNPRQPREVFEEEPLQELAHSIREFGLMQPIVVRVMPAEDVELAEKQAAEVYGEGADPKYEIIMGERRWRASRLAGVDTIPAIVRTTSDNAMLRDALLENIHRVQLNPLEEASAYQQLLDEFQVTQAQLAEKIGRSRPVITNMIRLLKLPVDVQRRVAAGVLSAGHARALLGVQTGREDQSKLAERIIAEGMSVRATEEAVTLLNRGEDAPQKKKREPMPQPEHLGIWADRLANSFDTKVTAQMGKRKGRLVIEFGDLDDFDRIMNLLDPGHVDSDSPNA